MIPKDVLNDLIARLDKLARSYSDCGLPTWGDAEMALLRETIQEWGIEHKLRPTVPPTYDPFRV